MKRPDRAFAKKNLLLLLVGGIPAVLLLLFVWAGGWLTPNRLTANTLIEVLEKNGGVHPGFRRNHAKGVCVIGEFISNGKAATLSRATVFRPGSVPVTGRLAIAGGNPGAPDYAVPVRSFALAFTLPDGEQWRSGMNALPFFSVATPQGFYDQQIATRPLAATGKPDPQKMQAFMQAHPEAKPFFQWAKTHVLAASWAQEQYTSLNAFRFIDAHNQSHFVRWSLVPHAPWQPVSAQDKEDKNYLASDLKTRLAAGPLSWDLLITVARPGDPVNDATKAWPQENPSLVAGTVVIHKAEDQQGGACNNINYDPLILPDGIAGSDDPLLNARSAAYAKSFNQRTIEETRQGQEKRS